MIRTSDNFAWSIAFSGALLFAQHQIAEAATNRDCLITPRIANLLPIYDLNKDGCIDAEERKLMQRDAGILPPEPPKLPTPTPAPNRPEPDKIETVLLVRDAYPVNPFLDGKAKLSDAGALFSYTSDAVDKQQTWAAKGAVITGVVSTHTASEQDIRDGFLYRKAFLTGVEFDRKFQNAAPSNTGSTSARAGFELVKFGGYQDELLRQYAKADFVYTTDFDGKASVFGFETYWQPMLRNWIVGRTAKISDNIFLGFRPTLAVDYFHVGDNGTFKALTPGSDYLWAGTKVSADLHFGYEYLKDFSFVAKYIYMVNTLSIGGHKDINYAQVSALYDIIKDTLALETRYTYGNTPRTLTKQNEFYAGLTVKIGDLPSGLE